MGFYKRALVFSLFLLLLACDSIDFCYYSDDFGDSGDFDTVNIMASESNCFYDGITKTYSENDNATIKSCLSRTVLSSLKNDSEDSYAYVEDYFDDISTVGDKDINSIKCNEIDTADNTITVTPAGSVSESDAEVAARNLFLACIDMCINNCASTTTPDDSIWIKANVKTGSNYIGIKIEKDVYISITASGTVLLDSDTNSSSMNFKKLGVDYTSPDFISKDGEVIALNIDIDRTTLGSTEFGNDLNNLLARSYLDFIELKGDLVADGSGEERSEAYKFQKPNFKYFSCIYSIKEEDSSRYEANCRFDHTGVVIASTLDAYYNSSNNFYTVAVFDGGNYYKYASNMIDKITLDANGNVNADASYSGKIVIQNGREIKQIMGNSDFDEGFIWNDLVDSYRFELNSPSKIAVKYIGSDSSGNCTFTVTDSRGYRIDSTNLDATQGELTYSNITYSYNESSGKKWQVLKTSEGKEIVFDQYSTDKYPTSAQIVLTMTSGARLSSCTKGLAIKLLPLKEYRIERDGLLFLYVPLLDMSGAKIKYTLVNPEALRVPSSSVSLYYKTTEFFEFDDNRTSFVNKEVTPLSSSEIGTLDDSDQENKDYNNLLSKAIFVRKGQILRLDYSNWLSVDGLKNISILNNATSNGTNPSSVDQGIGLSAFIKEKPPYFCYGGASESLNVAAVCSAENGIYSDIILANDATQGACFISLSSCTVAGTLESEFNGVNYRSKDCKYSSSSSSNLTSTSTSSKLSEFWSRVYTAYKALESYEDSSGATVYNDCSKETELANSVVCKNCYNETIRKVYDAAKQCANSLGINSDYVVYKGIMDNEGNESYKNSATIVSSGTDADDKIIFNSSISSSNTVSMADALNSLFVIKSSGTENSASTNYGTHFYYYKKLCKGGASKTECTVNLPQCYSMKNYKGRFSGLVARTKGNNNAQNVDSSGYLTPIDLGFGAEKLKNFSTTDGGLIKNFIPYHSDDSSTTSSSTMVKYNGNIYSKGSNFIRFFVIKDIDYSGGVFETALDNFNRVKLFNSGGSSHILKALLESSASYKNGERLAVFIGNSDNSKNYAGNPGAIKYNGVSVGVFNGSNGNSNSDNTILEIVKYKKDASNVLVLDQENTKFKFDSQGVLRTVAGGYGIDFSSSNYTIGNSYLNIDDKTKSIFFKIMDTDSQLSNNSGSYQIRIRTVNRSENTLVTHFRNFFNVILGFVDGSELSLKKSGGRPVPCPDDNSVSCIIYSEDDVSNNGNTCSYKDMINSNDCYEDCKKVDLNVVGSCGKYADGRGFVKIVFENFIGDPLYQFVAKLALILMITLYGFGYFFGLTNFTQSEIIPKIIRVCFIYFIISPSGWNFFDKFIVKFFKDGVDSILFLIAGSFETDIDSELSVALATRNYSDKSVIFSTCFSNLKLIFSDPIFNKLLGLAFSSWFGLIYLYLVATTVINYIIGVFSAITMYLNSQIYISLVLCFFPLVVLFMFFERTKKTLDNWVNLLVSFAGQQIFLVMTLSFFNILIYNFIKSTFSYTVCWMSILNMNIAGIPLDLISFWRIPTSSLLGSLNTINESMPSFYSIMSFYIVGVLMSKFMTGAAELGNSIFGASGGMSIAGGVAGMANSVAAKGGEFAKGAMKSAGTGFAKGVANRMGGSNIKEFGEKQQKERQERGERRNNFANAVDSKTEQGLNSYKNSSQFQQDMQQKRDADPGFKNMNKGQQAKKDKEFESSLLDTKEQEFRKNASVDTALSQMPDKVEEYMHSQGKDGKLGDQKDVDKKKYAEEYLNKSGLL
ncbi:MAG: type IV secretion system protein [Rickettsiales bacterium]|jgi:type IV secretory pathway VirB6-like protein|nr:type IV secretion system protein [Rickettsiales bacterium]